MPDVKKVLCVVLLVLLRLVRFALTLHFVDALDGLLWVHKKVGSSPTLSLAALKVLGVVLAANDEVALFFDYVDAAVVGLARR